MKMSFWSHCQGLILRLLQSRTAQHPRRQRSWLAESLEARTLLSSTPAMVADINPGAASSNPSPIVAIGSTTYFMADDGVHGQELWKSDGTAAGTMMVKDINPGSATSAGPYGNNLTNVNGTLFFTADDGVHGNELWKSDGTASGTRLVADVNPGSPGSFSRSLTNVNGTVFFAATDSVHGYELWKSDGTTAGTTLVKDIFTGGRTDYYGGYPTVYYPNSSLPAYLTNVNGMLFFAAYNGTGGEELWKSDGTAAGTTLVKDIVTGGGFDDYGAYFPYSSNPRELTNVNGTLFFSADNGTVGRELWKSDGTATGTTLVKDIFPGGIVTSYDYTYSPNSSSPADLTNVNGTLFFQADDAAHGTELWRSDGTAAGTVIVADIYPGYRSSYPTDLVNVNGTVFMRAYTTAGWELWKSDGTAAGTTLVKGNPGILSSGPGDLTNVNGTLFFGANDGTHGNELWQSNGTAAGTVMLADINPGGPYSSSYLANLTSANGTLFFTANDGIHGAELWTVPAANSMPAPSLSVNGFPTTTTAGVAGSFTVTARNADGTANAGYTGTVQFSTGDTKATIIDPATGNTVALQGFRYTFTATDAGVHTFSATLKTSGTQSLTATDAQTPAETATEGGILVKPAAASTMTVGGFPSTITAGVAGNFTVTLKDPYGNIATGYIGTVHFTSSDAKASLPGNYTFMTADAGKHAFSATFKTAGTRSITAADILMSALKATEGGITVSAAAASKFIITAPSTVTAGVPFNLTLTVEDAYGNVVSGYTGTVHFTSNDNSATLPANYTFKAADNGVHTFIGLVLRKKGQQTIKITETRNNSLTAGVTENVK